MKNFFRTSVLVLPLLLPMTVYGVDLGALHTLSKQGEPLDARVALSGVEDIKLNDLKVKLANNHDLGIAGVKGLENYGDVSVELVAESRDKIQAVVRTSQPVDQSYVSFLLEVRWPSGRLMREYTGLLKQGESKPQNVQPVVIQALDGEKETFSVVNAPTPKAAMSETTAVVVNPVVNVDVKPVDNVTHVKPVAPVTPVTIQAVQPAVHVEQQKQPIAVSLPKPVLPVMTDVEPAQSIVVKPKQTLWDIALNANLTGKYTNQQVALAIFENNRTAFKNGDINQLKK
ncbi:MAG: type IV pilus assembly protein FimV, partial [Pontibacterium sp.]